MERPENLQIGDRFIVTGASVNDLYENGDTCFLSHDDESTCPKFIFETGPMAGEEIWVGFEELSPCEPSRVDDDQPDFLLSILRNNGFTTEEKAALIRALRPEFK